MGKLGIMDILSFAKAGYSPKDVKELMEIEIPDKDPSPKNPEEPKSPEKEKPAESAAKEPAKDTASPDEPKADDIDYKKLYEAEAEKVKKLQEHNTKQNASNIEQNDPMEAVDDFLRGLM